MRAVERHIQNNLFLMLQALENACNHFSYLIGGRYTGDSRFVTLFLHGHDNRLTCSARILIDMLQRLALAIDEPEGVCRILMAAQYFEFDLTRRHK